MSEGDKMDLSVMFSLDGTHHDGESVLHHSVHRFQCCLLSEIPSQTHPDVPFHQLSEPPSSLSSRHINSSFKLSWEVKILIQERLA